MVVQEDDASVLLMATTMRLIAIHGANNVEGLAVIYEALDNSW